MSISLPAAWRRHAAAVVTSAVAALTLMSPARADAAPPVLADGFGLTQVAGAATGTATNFVITVTTSQVSGRHPIKIILPGDYHTNPTRRYPVLYFLHGSPDLPQNQLYPALTASDQMITVVPDGGRRGWYSNWLDQHTPAGAQNWETFHIGQVIPFIDANLRTIPARRSRAIAGVSMGGFGALHYAELHPDLFGQVASLSGDVDLSALSMDLRLATVASLIDAAGALCASASDPGLCGEQDLYKPAVDSDALFGTPYPVFNADWRWTDASPGTHVDRLAGMGVHVYTGANDVLELWVEGANKHFKDRLDAAGLPYHYVGYGDGSAWGCDGGHDRGCWEKDLEDLLPRLEQAFATA